MPNLTVASQGETIALAILLVPKYKCGYGDATFQTDLALSELELWKHHEVAHPGLPRELDLV